MIPPEEVEQSVREEHRDLVDHRRPTLDRLPLRRRNTDDDVAEYVPCELRVLTFAHGEREHVCRPIFVTIDLVQFMDSFVVGKKE